MKDNSIFNSGWIIVGFSFITLGLVYVVWYSFSVFFVALLKEFGWSRSIAAGAFSIFAIIHGMIGPFAGSMVDRFGPRGIILLGSFLVGAGLALCSFIQTWWQLYIFFGLITSMGVGSSGWIPITTIIQQWFKTKRGLATGIISSGIGVGILVCIPLIQYLIIRVGWRTTYRIMAFFIPLIIASIAISFPKRPLQTTSSCNVESETLSKVTKDYIVVDEEWTSQYWTVRRAIAGRQFWLLSFSFLLSNFITQSILTHQVAFFMDRGLEALFASYIVGIVGIVSIGGKILWSVLSDKIGREVTYTLGITCSILGMVSLIILNMLPSSNLPYVYALFFGMGYAVTATFPPLITANIFGGEAYGRIFGTLMILNNVGGAFGAWFAGFFHDRVGSYIPIFIILIVCAIFSCLGIWWVAPRKIRTVPGKRCKPR